MTPDHKNSSVNTETKNPTLADCEEAARQLIASTEEDERERNITRSGQPELTPEQEEIYRQALVAINQSGVKYAVGAAFARHAYTNIWRPTKDLDIFLKAGELRQALTALEEAGFHTEVIETHWLSKAWKGGFFIDVIFGSGHNQIIVNDDVLAGSIKTTIVGVPTQLIAVEELIAAACYIKERKRYDAPDSIHLILSTAGQIDWQRILRRLDGHRELLLMDLLLFDFIYPGHSDFLPKDLMRQLFAEVTQRWETGHEPTKTFRGSLLDPFSYTVDMEDWDYKDQRNIKPLVDGQGGSV